jgi:hypothetical protein
MASGEIVSAFLSGNTLNLEKLDSFTSADFRTGEWEVVNQDFSEMHLVGNRSFTIKPNAECFWGKQSTGPMIFTRTEGNFFFTSLIRTRKFSDTLNFPRDQARQFGGIMLRSASENTNENYIYIAVGHRDSDLYIEVKSTNDGISTSDIYKWPSGDAELMIRREAMVFGLYARPYGTKRDWMRVQTYYRPDLPKMLNAGLIAYSYSFGRDLNDFIAYFDDVNIRRENE